LRHFVFHRKRWRKEKKAGRQSATENIFHGIEEKRGESG